MTSSRRSGRRTVRALASSFLIVTLAACGSDGSAEEEAAPSESSESSDSGSGETEGSSEQSGDAVSAGGISFVPPEEWVPVEAEDLQAQGEGSPALTDAAESMGLAPEQLTQMMGQAELLLLDPQSGSKQFADNINVVAPGGEMPPAEVITQQYEQLGATVSDITTEDTELGEVQVVAYSLPASQSLEVKGSTLVMEGADGVVTLTISTTDEAKTTQVTEDILPTLSEG